MADNDKRIQEALSALMDNESSEMETLRILRDLEHNTELRDRWHRYQLASAALRRDLPPRMVDLSGRISDAIDAEQAPVTSRHRLLSPLSKFAVAATVAAVAVLGVRQFQPAPDLTATMASSSAAVETAPAGTTGPQFQLPAGFDFPPVSGRLASAGVGPEPRDVTIMQQVQPDLETQRAIQAYLNAMMQRHTENTSLNSHQGDSPYVRLPQQQDR